MKGILRKPWLMPAIVSVFLVAFVPLFNRQVVAAQVQAPWTSERHALAQSAPNVYLVDVIVLNLSDINLTAGTYSMDFYITFTCQNPPCSREPSWDILNSTSVFDAQEQGDSKPFSEYNYRVKADMIGRVDYSFYPFDYLYIDIFVEDKVSTSDELTYEFSSITADSYLFNPAGWLYDGSNDYGFTFPVQYGDPEATYDRLNIWLFLERDWFGAFMKTIFAAIVSVMIGMLSFLMKADATTERLALVSSTLVAIVLYHISLVAGVPATGYLTFTDKFMVWTYLIVFLSLVVSVMMMVYVNGGRTEKAERLHARTRWLIPLLWVLFMIFVFVKDLYLPYNLLTSNITWPENLAWLAKLLGYADYLPELFLQ
jgi:hypothetical protein